MLRDCRGDVKETRKWRHIPLQYCCLYASSSKKTECIGNLLLNRIPTTICKIIQQLRRSGIIGDTHSLKCGLRRARFICNTDVTTVRNWYYQRTLVKHIVTSFIRVMAAGAKSDDLILLTLDLLNPRHSVKGYYCPKFQVIPIWGFHLIMLK